MDETFYNKAETIFREKKKSPLFLRIAEKELLNKNYDRSIEILLNGLEHEPHCAAAYFLLGKAYSGTGNFREALNNYRKGSEIIGSDKTYRYYLGEIAHIKRKMEETENQAVNVSFKEYSSLLSDPQEINKKTSGVPVSDDHLVSETLAKIYLSQGETTEALKVYEKLITKYPLKKLYFESRIKEIKSGSK